MEVVVEFAFINKLGVIRVGGFDFDGDFEVGFGVDSLVDFPEGSLIDFSDDFEVLAHFLKHLRHSHSVINNKLERKFKLNI